MDTSTVYLCVLGGIFATLLLSRVQGIIGQTIGRLETLLNKHLIYPLVLSRWRGKGVCSRIALARKMMYVAVNLFFLLFKHITMVSIGQKAGILAVSNMVPLYLGTHHGAMADYLGLSLSTFRTLHVEMALMAVSMAAIHTIIAFSKGPTFTWQKREHLHGVIVRHLARSSHLLY